MVVKTLVIITSYLHLNRTNNINDLNEPNEVEEVYTAADVHNLCNETCSKEDIERSAISVDVCSIWHLEKEFSESVGGTNLQLKKEKNQTEWPAYTFNLNDVYVGSQSESNDLQSFQTPMTLGFSNHIS